ncbi:unnamed protein product [Rotaria sp. Silwood1]|nr:unnamed protein product [Rotaria sp. Silwood1]CAF1302964.1 unnamed protein product [Rotaria sp. Silwood1]CAF3499343.1 unnamed protein product [Rotaria sp. Silwood1]CAF3528906.1 unnamed protein product [Rotaria sp. Silwood1]CAF4672593.1 unnamed protein product [Rotaria sp. Silwood1]
MNITKLTGYIPDLIKLLQNKDGFIPDIQVASLNRIYDGLIQAAANDDYDTMIGDCHVSTVAEHLLTMDLTLLKSKNIISQINDIKSGKISFYRIGIRSGSESEHYCLREISDGNKNYYPLKSQQELYDSLLDGNIDASFMDTGMAEYITNNIYCNLTLIGQDFDKGVFGIVTPNEWLYAKVLIVNILLLRESGQLDILREK